MSNYITGGVRPARTSRRGRLLSALTIVALLIAPLVAVIPASTADATISNRCDGTAANDQNSLRVSPSHGSVFYIDSGQSVDAAYVAYRLGNLSSTQARDDMWISVDSFSGGVVRLANPADAVQPLGDVAASSTKTGFFLLKAATSTNTAQSHVVRVYSGKPGTLAAQELYSCTYSFAKVAETIKAAANKVTSITSTSVSTVGSTMTVTVLGATGTIGAGSAADGSMVWLSPVAKSSWPTGALRLETTSFGVFTNQGRTQVFAGSPFVNQLRIPLPSGSKYFYTAVYTFRIIGTAAVSSSDIIPIAQIASGTQIKHTDLGSISGALNAGASQVNATVAKSVSSTSVIAGNGATRFTYSIAITNSGSALQVDQVVDAPSSSLAFVPGSATFDGSSIPDASALATDASRLIFAGPFAVPAGTVGSPTTKVITYSMSAAPCTGAYSYANRATATIGAVSIGSSSSTQSLTTATGTCGNPVVTAATTNENLPVDVVTAPASSVTISAATLNAMVDPNGTSGLNIQFEYSTSPTLVGATLVAAGQTTTAATPYAVASTLTGLISGTTYFFRARVGDVLGDIFSFTTQEPAGTPTATTVAATSITTTSAVLNGSVDPNLITNGVKVRFQYATDNSSGACTSLGSTTTTGFVQSETDTSTEDALLLGAFPTDVSFSLTGLTTNNYYCFKVVAYYNASTANWSTAAPSPTWGSFRAVARTSQTISFSAPATLTVQTTTSAAATATSGLAIDYTSDTPSVCTVDSAGTITGVSAGICSITANQPGTLTVDPAAPVSAAFLVVRRSQTISFTAPDDMVVSDSVSNPASTTPSTSITGLTVSYSSSTPEVCSVDSSGVISALGAGSCTIVASQDGNDEYAAATSQSVSFVVRLSQTITFPTPGSIPTASSVTATATTTGAGLEVHYESLTPTICSVDGSGVITGLNVGECRIRATQSGSALYAPAPPVTAAFTITAGPPVIVTDSLPDGTLGSEFDLVLEAGGGEGTYSNWTITGGSLPNGVSLDSSTGQLSGTPLESGSFTIDVTVDSGELASPVKTFEFTIAKKSHSVLPTPITAITATYGDPSAASPASSSANLPLSYSSSNPDVAVIVDGNLVFGQAGEATITVNSAGNEEYVDADAITFSVTVSPAELTVTAPNPSVNYGDPIPDLTPAITGFVGEEDSSVLLTDPTCSSLYDSGTDADQNPSVSCSGASASNYTVSYVEGAISIAQVPQSITVVPDPLQALQPSGTQSVTATSTSGLPVTIAATGECTWEAGILTATSVEGTCVVTASIPASTNYLAAIDVVLSTEVTNSAPIGRDLEAQLDVSGESHPIDATLTVLWSIDPNVGTAVLSVPTTTAVCTVDETGAITLLTAGLCTINVDVAADDTYSASHTTVSFMVTKLTRTISLTSAIASVMRPTMIALTALPSAGTGALSYLVTDGTEVCALSSTDVIGLRAGACGLTVTIAEDARYYAATSSVLLLSFTDPTTPVVPEVPTTPVVPQVPTTPVVPQAPTAPDAPPVTQQEVLAAAPTASTPVVVVEQLAQLTIPRPVSGARQFALGSMDAARRTLFELASEKLNGFAPGSGLITQVTGSRSIGQFVAASGSLTDPIAIGLAIDESNQRLGTEFASIRQVSAIDAPFSDAVLNAAITDDAFEVFAASGLASPVSVGGLPLASSTNWLEATVNVAGYVPGTVVYLAVTTDPIIFGAALVDSMGNASVTGTLPVDLLDTGGHTIRLVGTRLLDGATADGEGSIVISDAAMNEIQRFDQGTMATVEIIGASSEGGTHYLVREVLLNGEGPWWTVWLLAIVAALLLAWQLLSRSSSRGRSTVATASVVVLTALPLAAGWLTGYYDIMVVGAVIGIAGAIGQRVVRSVSSREVRREVEA